MLGLIGSNRQCWKLFHLPALTNFSYDAHKGVAAGSWDWNPAEATHGLLAEMPYADLRPTSSRRLVV